MTTKKFNLFTKIVNYFDTSSPIFTTRVSTVVCIFLAILGIFIGATEGSLAILTNGLISAIDVLNSAIFLMAVNRSVKSPDYIYNYGYGKYESLSILASAGILFGILGYTLYEAIVSFGHTDAENGNYAIMFTFSFSSLIAMVAMYKFQKKSAKKFKMSILEYDASIWKIDSFLELGVLFNLIIGFVFLLLDMYPYAIIIDSITALGLNILALKVPIKGSKNALDQLLDKTVDEKIQLDILSVVALNFHEMCEFRAVHTRQSGKDIFVEIDIILPPEHRISEKWEAEDKICDEIRKMYPTSVPRVYATPCKGECLHDGISSCPIKVFKELNNKNTNE